MTLNSLQQDREGFMIFHQLQVFEECSDALFFHGSSITNMLLV
jgi:hypothetical protein